MFSKLRFDKFFSLGSSRFFNRNRFSFNSNFIGKKARLSLLTGVYLAFLPGNINLQDDKKVSSKRIDNNTQSQYLSPPVPLTFWGKIWHAIIHIIRFWQLILIFAPTILLSPLLLFKRTQNYWMDCFVKAIERSGVVFIKAFQYLSHRRDIIGP